MLYRLQHLGHWAFAGQYLFYRHSILRSINLALEYQDEDRERSGGRIVLPYILLSNKAAGQALFVGQLKLLAALLLQRLLFKSLFQLRRATPATPRDRRPWI